jgi:hypothetical protein
MIALQFNIPSVNGSARGTITAHLDGKPLHVEKGDWLSATARERFCQMVAKKANDPAVAAQLESNIVEELDRRHASPAPAQSQSVAFDVSNVVRPDLFIRPAVIGLSVAQPVLIDGRPAGKWILYLLWADGRREAVDLPETLDLPDGSKLWIDPLPCDPTASTMTGWSRDGQQRWLDGAPAPDPVAVFHRLCDAIDSFIEFPEEHARAMTATLALFIMLSYVYPAWNAVPYLSLGGPAGSGKSRVLEVLSRTVLRALGTSNTTAACLFRTLHERGGVLLLDEAERLKDAGPDASDLRSILLAGYKHGGKASRLEKVGDGFQTCWYDVYGLKVMACINGLPPALASRCIQFIMFRAAPGSMAGKRRIDADPKRWADLRDDLHALALGPMGQKAIALSGLEVCTLSNRNHELWQPLMALAAWLEGEGAGDLLALIPNYANHLVESSTDDATPDADETLLRILAAKVKEGRAPTPGEVLAEAKASEPETFQRWQARAVSVHLRRYGVETRKSNGVRFFDPTLGDLSRVQARYGIDLGIGAAGE